MEIFGELKNYIFSHVVGVGTGPASEDANDEASQPMNSATLPPNPYGSHTPTAAKTPATTSIDLTLSPNRSEKREHGRDTRQSWKPESLRKSADEKRLIADYHTPSDRVYAPDPQSYFQTPPRRTMVKPNSTKSFHPINTIDEVNPGPGSSRPIKYGKSSRSNLRLIGKVRGVGQLEYERRIGKSPTTTAPIQNALANEDRVQLSAEAPHPKRRKSELVESKEVIDLVDDGDIQDFSTSISPTTPLNRGMNSTRSSHSSRSRQSIGSGTALNSSQLSQTQSAFQQTDNIVSSRRKRTRTPAKQNNHVALGASSDQGKSCSRNASIMIEDDESPIYSEPARKKILQEMQQGVLHHAADEGKHSKDQASLNPLLPNARINESLASVSARPTSSSGSRGSRPLELRDFRRTNDCVPPDDSMSEDELAIDVTSPRVPPPRKPSPTRSSHILNRGTKRKAASGKIASEDWPLVFARARGFEAHANDRADGDYLGLILQHHEEKAWRILQRKGDMHAPQEVIYIESKCVNRYHTDTESRIRIEGPRQQDGNAYTYDLRFADTKHLQAFQQQCNRLVGKEVLRTEGYMEKVFAKELHKNEKTGTSSIVSRSDPAQDEEGVETALADNSPLWQRKRVEIHPSRQIQTTTGNSVLGSVAATSNASTRPVRSTRTSAPARDMTEIHPEEKVEKFSVDVGLGPRWSKALTYGEGRRKATIYFDDLPRLDEEEFLNDSLIDFYMIYLFEHYGVPKDKVFFFNTYFFTQLTKNTGREYINYKAVERWTRDDVFKYDYIVVPINQLTHWYLAIICNVGNIVRKPVVEHFDDDLAGGTATARPEPTKQSPSVGDKSQDDSLPILPCEVISSPHGEIPQYQIKGAQITTDEHEPSKLDLIDPEDIGADSAVKSDMVQVDPNQPSNIVERVDVERSYAPLVPDEPPTTVLSNLKASPTKKRTKRKQMVQKRDPNLPVIIILDSLSGNHSPAVRALKNWLAAEGKAKRGMEAMVTENGLYPKSSQIPVQGNFSDCGVFLLGYADKFFQNPDEFKHKLLTGEMSADDDWPNLQPKNMRSNLRGIIFKLAEEQKLTAKKGKKVKTVSTTVHDPRSAEKEEVVRSGDRVARSEAPAPESFAATEANRIESSNTMSTSTLLDNLPKEQSNKPRLSSPFSPKVRSRAISQPQSPMYISKISDSPPVSGSETTAVTRISTKSKPDVIEPARTQHEQSISLAATTDGGAHVTRRLTGPSDRRKAEAVDPMQVGTTTGKQILADPQQNEQNQTITRTSRKKAGHRTGGVNDPIQINDSQDEQHKASERGVSEQTGEALDWAVDAMEIDSQDACTTIAESQDVEMREADAVVAETPETDARSP